MCILPWCMCACSLVRDKVRSLRELEVEGEGAARCSPNNGNGSGDGVRHGQEQYHGGFDGHHRGSRGHQGGHRHHGPPFPVPPPTLVFAPPPTPIFSPQPFYGSYYGPIIGYAQTEFVPCWYDVLPPQDALHFVSYPTLLPVHPMFPHMEQQQAAQPLVVEEPKPAQPTAEKLEEKIRLQVEFYFSESNLCTDLLLKEQMDEQDQRANYRFRLDTSITHLID